MKRRIFKRILLFLLLGAIINVAVAWACAYKGRTPLQGRDFLRSHEGDSTWYFIGGTGASSSYVMASTFPFADVGWQYKPLTMPPWSMVNKRPDPSDGPVGSQRISDVVFWIEEAYGWPMLGLVGRVEIGWDLNKVVATRDAIAIKRNQDWIRQGRMFPLRPLFPGFAINTMFYAAVLWVPFALIGVIRHRRRITRGLCPACGYDLRGHDGASDTCPECGRAAKQ